MEDKAVSTEDLCAVVKSTSTSLVLNPYLEVVRLEAVLNTLVENKIVSMKNEKRKFSSSLHSSPKNFIKRLRLTSSSTVSSKENKDDNNSHTAQTSNINNSKVPTQVTYQDESDHSKKSERMKRLKGVRVGGSSRSCEVSPQHSDGDQSESTGFLQCDANAASCSAQKNYPGNSSSNTCCCNNEAITPMEIRYDDGQYIALKIEADYDEDVMMTAEAMRLRAQRRRRRRRKRRMKRQLALDAAQAMLPRGGRHEDSVKIIDPDELPQRARWTIVITACLLMFMCLLLVGITLRMAPLIDDMVRKENEELMNAFHRQPVNRKSLQNSTASVPIH